VIAEILSIGDELLFGQTIDTNAAYLSRQLNAAGIVTGHRQTCGDDAAHIEHALQLAFTRSELVILIGGLGPTEDDKTREGMCAALNVELVHDPAIESEIREIFARRRLSWVDANRKQAMVPAGGTALSNPNGTAPGLFFERDNLKVIALPGPPRELIPMFETHILPRLTVWSGGVREQSLSLRAVGIGESALEAKISDLYGGSVLFGTYAKPGEVVVRLHKTSAEDAMPELRTMANRVRDRLGNHIYAEGDTTLSAAVLSRLGDLEQTLATAESLTGGGVGEAITAEEGSGKSYLGGVVTYSADHKVAQLGVSRTDIERYTPVSEQVAKQMARCVREKFGATYGISTTGVAGPGPDPDGNPEGKVFVAFSSAETEVAVEHAMMGSRGLIRDRTIQAVLTLLWNQLPAK